MLMRSGLYELLTKAGMMIKHEEVEPPESNPEAYKILLPEQIETITYPYEWCSEQLRDAALLTLDVLEAAMDKGMILKDASAFNIQFLKGRPAGRKQQRQA